MRPINCPAQCGATFCKRRASFLSQTFEMAFGAIPLNGACRPGMAGILVANNARVAAEAHSQVFAPPTEAAYFLAIILSKVCPGSVSVDCGERSPLT